MANPWSPEQYLAFEHHRTRPAIDLLARIRAHAPGRVTDLGCGPGNSTELLARRFPEATVMGIDSSPEMIAAAERRLPELRFDVADIATWQPQEKQDLLFANAVLQWLPDHRSLLPRLLSRLSPGGTLAFQMPDNLDEPSHTSITAVARDPRWCDRLSAASAERTAIKPMAVYYALLADQSDSIEIWRTTYVHPLDGLDAIVDWFTSTALMPYLKRLTVEEKPRFRALYREAIAAHYPVLDNGTVLLPFPRLFVVATRR